MAVDENWVEPNNKSGMQTDVFFRLTRETGAPRLRGVDALGRGTSAVMGLAFGLLLGRETLPCV